MIGFLQFQDQVTRAFQPKARGIVGLVDDLLGLCQVHQLRIDFQDGRCIAHRLGAKEAERVAVDVPKSVFRASLARVAAILDEKQPQSATPYRGEGDIVVRPASLRESTTSFPPSTCHVSFANTPSEQRLEMRFSRASAPEGNRFTVLLRDQRTVTVFGHALKFIPSASNSTDQGSYGVLSHADGDEITVALFRVSEVIGVFFGEKECGMSSDSHRRNIQSVNRELGQLYSKLADERKREADLTSKIAQVQGNISKATSAGTVESKLREIERLNKDNVQSKKRQADISKQIANK